MPRGGGIGQRLKALTLRGPDENPECCSPVQSRVDTSERPSLHHAMLIRFCALAGVLVVRDAAGSRSLA